MNKETKRYSLVEYVGKLNRIVYSEKEYDELVAYIKKINRRSTSAFYYGNISRTISDGQIRIEIHMYNRLTMPRTISDLDAECSEYCSVKEYLREEYSDRVKHVNPDVYISYFETKNSNERTSRDVDVRIKPLPLFFDCDQKYFDESYIKKCLVYHANEKDIAFFKRLCEEFCLNHDVTDDIIRLRRTINLVENENGNPFYLSVDAMSLYKRLVYQRDSNRRVYRDENGKLVTSHRKIRDFGSFVRDYQMVGRKRLSATHYNVPQDPRDLGKEPTVEQMQLKIVK